MGCSGSTVVTACWAGSWRTVPGKERGLMRTRGRGHTGAGASGGWGARKAAAEEARACPRLPRPVALGVNP